MEKNNDEIVFYELRNNKGVTVAKSGYLNNLPIDFSSKAHNNFSNNDFINAYRENENGSIQLIVNKKNELFQGRKAIQRACDVYLSLVPKFKQIELKLSEITNRITEMKTLGITEPEQTTPDVVEPDSLFDNQKKSINYKYLITNI